jgi:galactokinase
MAVKYPRLRPVSKWIEMIKDTNSTFHKKLGQIYGDNGDTKNHAADMCWRTLEAFSRAYNPGSSVMIVRSTGRVNLVGTHIDHRGGSVNPICIKDMWLVAEPRNDDIVMAKNVESEEFADEQFCIKQCMPVGEKIRDWDFWCYQEYEKRKGDASVTWSNYIRAAVLYLQHLNTRDDGSFALTIRGMNTMFYGDIPRAAGLASSSALVMAAAEAVIRLNNLRIEPADMIEHWGFAEWYVGTRGGCSDHAAIIHGRPDKILHITAFPAKVDSTTLPNAYNVLLVNSLIEARKRVGARDIFNSRVAAYIFGLMMLRKDFPQYADKLQRLRDVSPERLGINEAEIYRMVKSLPETVSRAEIMKLLPESEQKIHRVFRSHNEPEQGYQIRQICLYGIAECIRADMVPDCLRKADFKAFGELISISHNGDRVTKLVDGERVPTDNSYPDERIDALIGDLESGNPQRISRARLWKQGGGYNVSLPELDMLVDIALATPGVVGAGLVGAGMGGCIVVVVKDKCAQHVIDNLTENYYRPRNLKVAAEVVTAVGGLCTIDV